MNEPKEVRLSVRVTPEFLERVKSAAANKGILMSALVVQTLSAALDEMEESEFQPVAREEFDSLKKRIELLEDLVMREVA